MSKVLIAAAVIYSSVLAVAGYSVLSKLDWSKPKPEKQTIQTHNEVDTSIDMTQGMLLGPPNMANPMQYEVMNSLLYNE